jgi:hypothetical protein
MQSMRAALSISLFLALACESEPRAKAPAAHDTTPALAEGLAMFFKLDESGDTPRMDQLNGVQLVPWQRTGYGAYDANGRGTTPVSAAVGMGQHVQGSSGYHFATWNQPALQHPADSFTWAGWVSVDLPDAHEPYLDDQTMLAKWNGMPDSAAPNDQREYRIWHDQALSRWRFEVSSDGLEGAGHSQIVTHPAEIERDRLYFIEAWRDAEANTISLRVSTQGERGEVASEVWSEGVFSGEADLDVGAQNTCTDDHLQGVIDALGYWTRVLSERESAALWNDGAGFELPRE